MDADDEDGPGQGGAQQWQEAEIQQTHVQIIRVEERLRDETLFEQSIRAAQPPPAWRTASRMRMAPAPYIAIINGNKAIIEAGRDPSRYSPMSGLMTSRQATGTFEDFIRVTLVSDAAHHK